MPAAIYLAVNPAGDAARRGGASRSPPTPRSLLGVLALVGATCRRPLRVFLLTLTIVDDVAALAIIAFFYSDDVDGRCRSSWPRRASS